MPEPGKAQAGFQPSPSLSDCVPIMGSCSDQACVSPFFSIDASWPSIL